jgi:nitrous-oxide reductase
MKHTKKTTSFFKRGILGSLFLAAIIAGCKHSGKDSTFIGADAAGKVYVAPGKYDELYLFTSGGFSGQVDVYGLPSGRLFKVIPVFSQNAENGWGYSEETKPMLQTTHGFIPWGDSHHPQLSRKDGSYDGRWLFINENNTPRVARIDLKTFTTSEIIEIPNCGGNHPSPYCTENTEYLAAGGRFSIPFPNKDVPIAAYKENFRGLLSLIKVGPADGKLDLAVQILLPPFDYDLARAGKGVSKDWFFFTCYNSEKANTMLEVNASQNDKDFILAVNWKKAIEYLDAGKAKEMNTPYCHNTLDESTHTASSETLKSEKILDPKDCPGMLYYMPCPKSPHGCDVSPDGEYITASGKLAAMIPVFSFTKMTKAIESKAFDGEAEGIPILKYDAVIAGVVQKPGLGPLHTEFDDKGYAYTSMFLSSEIVKWKLGTWEVVDHMPVYYSVGHLCVPGGDTKTPYGKYVIALNKITKDRYLPTGPEECQSAQLIDISGEKMQMLLDFPTIGEPHYAQAIAAEMLTKNSKKIYKLEDNKHPYAIKSEQETKVLRSGNEIHVYLTCIRSHFAPDNIEGIKLGDVVYFHVTNLEQDWDVPHGFAVKGNNNSELLIMPGETCTIKWVPDEVGIVPFYCSDFCSALHQEMQGYIRVSDRNSSVPVKWSLNEQK